VKRHLLAMHERSFASECDFRYWHLADIALRSINVRFKGQGRHRADMRPCLLMNQSGHWQLKVVAVPLDP